MLGKSEKKSDLKFKPKSRVGSLIGFFLVLAALLIYVFVARPVGDQIETAEASITENKAKITSLESELAILKIAEEELDLTSFVKQQQATRAVPIGVNQDEIIRDFINLSDIHDVELNSLGFGKGGSESEGVNSLRVNSSFEGTYSDLIGFLEGIEQNERIFRVNTISVQLDELGILGIQRATFSLSMESFYQ